MRQLRNQCTRHWPIFSRSWVMNKIIRLLCRCWPVLGLRFAYRCLDIHAQCRKIALSSRLFCLVFVRWRCTRHVSFSGDVHIGVSESIDDRVDIVITRWDQQTPYIGERPKTCHNVIIWFVLFLKVVRRVAAALTSLPPIVTIRCFLLPHHSFCLRLLAEGRGLLCKSRNYRWTIIDKYVTTTQF